MKKYFTQFVPFIDFLFLTHFAPDCHVNLSLEQVKHIFSKATDEQRCDTKAYKANSAAFLRFA